MFKRLFIEWRFACVLWLWFVPVTHAQSNQPIGIDTAPPTSASHTAKTPTPSTASTDRRLSRLAQRLADRPSYPDRPTPPSPPVAPTVSVEPVGEDQPLPHPQSAQPDRGAAPEYLLVDPIERQPLGMPSGSSDAQAAPAHEVPKQSDWILKTLSALGVVVGVILLLRVLVTRFSSRAATSTHSPVLEVLTRVSIAPRNHVLLIRLGNRILVVGDSSAGLQTLADIDDPEEIVGLLTGIASAKSNSISTGFTHLLSRFNSDYDTTRRIDEGADDTEQSVDRARDQVSSLRSRIRALSRSGEVA